MLGELLVTAGVLVLAFIGWQLWLNDLVVGNQAQEEAIAISQEWQKTAGGPVVVAEPERADPGDPESMVLGLGEGGYLLGKVLFHTDKSAIRPEFEPLLDRVAQALDKRGGGTVAVIGHTDVRGSHAYNAALGLRRAKAVFDALAQRLSPEVRAKLRVDVNNDQAAPAGVKRQ